MVEENTEKQSKKEEKKYLNQICRQLFNTIQIQSLPSESQYQKAESVLRVFAFLMYFVLCL